YKSSMTLYGIGLAVPVAKAGVNPLVIGIGGGSYLVKLSFRVLLLNLLFIGTLNDIKKLPKVIRFFSLSP
ncbi:hypothetical protein, partial [Bacillus aquiflavi]